MTGEERNARTYDDEEYELRAVDVRLYNLDEPRDAKIVAWRLECLERCLTTLDASALAVRRDVDVHEAVRLAKAGASSAQVVAILL